MKFLIALIAGLLVGTGAYADVTGNITPPGGVGATIPIPLTNLVPSPPSTVLSNCTSGTATASANPISCVIGQYLPLSTVSGVDCTGATDSRAAVISALATVAGTNKTLLVDCPVYLQMGLDQTKSIFFASYTSLYFTPTGKFLVDPVGFGAFMMLDYQHSVWTNMNVEYIAGTSPSAVSSFGVAGIDYGDANAFTTALNGSGAVQQAYQQTLYNTTSGVQGLNYTSGGSFLGLGTPNVTALFQIRGNSYDLHFVGSSHIYVPNGVTADYFIPMVFNVNANWTAGQTVTAAAYPPTPSELSFPHDIVWDGFTVDGTLMGWSGSGYNLTIRHLISQRYSVLQDQSGGTNNVGGIGPYHTWFSPPHLIYMDTLVFGYGNALTNFSINIDDVLDEGIYVGTSDRMWTGAGYSNSLKVELSNDSTVRNYRSRRPDGGCEWLAAGYVSYSVAECNAEFNTSITSSPILTFAAPPTGTGAPLLNVWPYATANLPVTFSDLETKTVTFTQYSTSTSWTGALSGSPTAIASVVTAQLPAFGDRFPSNPALINATIRDKLTDTATTPTGFPTAGFNGDVAGNYSFDITVPDWPSTATYFPGMGMGGDRMTVRANVKFLACSNTTYRRGVVNNQGTAFALTNSVIDVVVNGWRSFNNTNIENLKQLIVLSSVGYVGNRVRVLDVNNNWEGVVDNGGETDTWVQEAIVTPTGSTYTTGIVFPASMAIDRIGYRVVTNLDATNGLTTVGVGCGSSPTALLAAQSHTTGQGVTPAFAPTIGCGSNAIVLTPTAGTFGTTGTLLLSVRGTEMLGSN